MQALARVHARGAEDALARFGMAKTAGPIDWAIRGAKSLGVFGMAPEAFVQGRRALAPNGALSLGNVLWPTVPGSRLRTWGGRLGTIGAATMLPGMMRSDPDESRAARTLGSLGGLAGMMYGGTAGGLLGAPVGLALGRGLGHGVGHLIG